MSSSYTIRACPFLSLFRLTRRHRSRKYTRRQKLSLQIFSRARSRVMQLYKQRDGFLHVYNNLQLFIDVPINAN